MEERIKSYRENPAVSYSLLSALSVHPMAMLGYVNKIKKEGSGLTKGSLLDCIMFSPSEFGDVFSITKIKKPSGEMEKWLDAYLNIEIPPDFTLSDTDKLILKAREISGYNQRLSNDIAIKKFHSECDEYLNECAVAGDRVIITQEEYEESSNMAFTLLTHPDTSPYFANSKFQVDRYFSVEGTDCKILLDGVWIDEDKKTIIPWDLKRISESTLSFNKHFINYRYYIQAALYRLGVIRTYEGYTVLPFRFIAANPNESPMIYEVDNKLHVTLLLGGTTSSGRQLKGLYQLLDDYNWHIKNNLYEYPAEYYRNNRINTITI